MDDLDRHVRLTRRELLKASTAAAASLALSGCAGILPDDRGMRASTAIIPTDYGDGLLAAIENGFALVPPPDMAGKRVLLKPNLVDLPREGKPITTHPAIIVAVAEAVRRRGAAEVIVADGPALQRDAWQIVDAIGLTPLLRGHHLPFIDLNLAEMVHRPNAGGNLPDALLYFSRPAVEADILMSLPKMKTHHWAGASLAMKNMFGTVSSLAYGWPRNTFHLRGLHPAVIDFNLTRPVDYAIIDGVVGLEGDGPVRGTPIDVGVIVMGDNAAAVDATAARVMGLAPERIDYLRRAAGLIGPVLETSVEQRGEPIAAVRTPFQVVSTQTALII